MSLLTLKNLTCDLEVHFSPLMSSDKIAIVAGDTVGEKAMVAYREIYPMNLIEYTKKSIDLTFREYIIDGQNYNFLSHNDIAVRKLRPNENNRLALYINITPETASQKIVFQNIKGTITVFDKPRGNETLVIEENKDLSISYEIGYS